MKETWTATRDQYGWNLPSNQSVFAVRPIWQSDCILAWKRRHDTDKETTKLRESAKTAHEGGITEGGKEKGKGRGTRRGQNLFFLCLVLFDVMDQKALHAGRNAACRRKKNRKAVEKTWNTMRQWALKNWQEKKNTRGIGRETHCCLYPSPSWHTWGLGVRTKASLAGGSLACRLEETRMRTYDCYVLVHDEDEEIQQSKRED